MTWKAIAFCLTFAWLWAVPLTLWAEADGVVVYDRGDPLSQDADAWTIVNGDGRLAEDVRDGRQFRFRNDTVTLKLGDLPEHAAVSVHVRVVAYEPWAGEAVANHRRETVGPDQWGLRVVGGPTLVHSTFPYAARGKRGRAIHWRQMDPIDRDDVPTRAFEQADSWPDKKRRPHTQVIEAVFPHTGQALQLRGYGIGLAQNNRWHIVHTTVRVHKTMPAPDPRTSVDQLISRLHGSDPAAAEAAVWQLVRHGDPAIAPLIKSLTAPPPAQADAPARLRRLLADLDAADFERRESATAALLTLPDDQKLRLHALARHHQLSPEQRWRLEEALPRLRSVDTDPDVIWKNRHRAFPPRPSDADRRRARVRRVLALIGSPAADRARRDADLPLAAERIRPGAQFTGTCSQNGYPTYPMVLKILRVKGDKVEGEIHWPTLRNTQSRFRGTLADHRLTFTEYEIIVGSGIVIPVDYHAYLVDDAITGDWLSKNERASFQIFHHHKP